MAAPPGPMNAVIAEESVRRGWTAGFRAGLGAMTGDAIFCVLAFVGVVEVVQHAPRLRAAMVGVGGALMLVFAVDAATGVKSAAGMEAPGTTTKDVEGTEAADETVASGALDRTTGFRKALVLALTNPYQIVFWLTVGVGLLRAGTLDLVTQAPWLGELLGTLGLGESLVIETGSLALLVGFFGGIGLWITGYPATLVAVDRRSERAGPVVAGISALVLGGFGILFLIDGVTGLV
ncbi:LysE family translocator [Salinarchaeum sp. Harcht-Bsk1]|uniref:LysE family translocator n=1 Tax=Salinarchaeum sp. Harcht-Bsk1 TaxID=1333523 RepID=UPI0009DBFDEC|nr:LysE family transporter [Salinarchaeum sp. Harcht-Bsk1]